MKQNSITLLITFIVCLVHGSGLAQASPIYVFKEPDGSIRFTNRTPPAGVTYKIFSAKKPSFSVYKVHDRGWRAGRLNKDAYHDIIVKAAAEHSLDPALIKAVIHVESAFNKHAVSPKGARGLMQLMPGTAKDLGVKQVFHPDENITGGAKLLARLLVKYNNNLKLALAAYNAGEDNVDTYNGIPPFAETQAYVRKVLEMKERYRLAA
jgi:soluble lytic murein transglycosylase-like protein